MIVDEFENPIKRTDRSIKARYDAAQQSPDTSAHWSEADSLSAVCANSAMVRQKLRDRSRYEIANNSYARGILDSIANYTIGSGPTLQIQPPTGEPSDSANQVERLFNDWMSDRQIAHKLHTLQLALDGDGEGFAILTDSESHNTPVSLDVRLYEADHFEDYSGVSQLQDDAGVRINSNGEPTEYAFQSEHPGDRLSLFQASRWIPADSVLHVFREDRPGQLRGIPKTTPCLGLFAQLRRFTLATLTAAEAAANFAGIVSGTGSDDDNEYPLVPLQEIAVTRGMLTALPDDVTLSQLKAEHPNATFDEFVRALLREIARCLGVPAVLALGDASEYNYSSGRLDLQAFNRQLDVDRSLLFGPILRRIYSAWLQEALLIPGFLPDAFDPDTQITWRWPGAGSIDRAKEALGQRQELQNNTTTLAREYARQGLDWEQELRQRAREKALMRELGLTEQEVN